MINIALRNKKVETNIWECRGWAIRMRRFRNFLLESKTRRQWLGILSEAGKAMTTFQQGAIKGLALEAADSLHKKLAPFTKDVAFEKKGYVCEIVRWVPVQVRDWSTSRGAGPISCLGRHSSDIQHDARCGQVLQFLPRLATPVSCY